MCRVMVAVMEERKTSRGVHVPCDRVEPIPWLHRRLISRLLHRELRVNCGVRMHDDQIKSKSSPYLRDPNLGGKMPP